MASPTLQEVTAQCEEAMNKIHLIYSQGEGAFYMGFDILVARSLANTYNLRKKLLTEADQPVPEDALHQIIVMYIKRTKLANGRWTIDLRKVGEILAEDMRARKAKERAEREERERKAAAEKAKREEVERKDRERKQEVAERAKKAEDAKKKKEKPSKEAESGGVTERPKPVPTGHGKPMAQPKAKKPNAAGPSRIKSKADIGSETDGEGVSKPKKAAGQSSKEVEEEETIVVKPAVKGGKGKAPAKGAFRDKKDEEEEREREEKEAKARVKGKGKAREKPTAEEPAEKPVLIRRPKESEDGRSDGEGEGEEEEGGGDSEDPEEDGSDLYKPDGDSDAPLMLAEKRKVKVSPTALEKAFYVFEICAGCATSSIPCTYTMQRCLKTKNGKKIACDACNHSKKKCQGGAATAMAFAQPLGDYATLVYPPLPDGSIKQGVNMEGNTEKLATVGDLFTTLVKEQRVLGRMVAETRAGLDRLKTGTDTVPQYFNTLINSQFELYDKRMDALQHEMRDERLRILAALKKIEGRLDDIERPTAGPSTTPVLEEILEQLKSLQQVRPSAFGEPCPNPSLVLRPAEFDIDTPPAIPQPLPETTTKNDGFQFNPDSSPIPQRSINDLVGPEGGDEEGGDEEARSEVEERPASEVGDREGKDDATMKPVVEEEEEEEGKKEGGDMMGVEEDHGSDVGPEGQSEEEDNNAAPDPSPPKTRSRAKGKAAGQSGTKAVGPTSKAAGQPPSGKRKATDSPEADADPGTKEHGPQKKKSKQ